MKHGINTWSNRKKQNRKDIDLGTGDIFEIIPITEIQKPKIDPTIARRPSEMCELHDHHYNHLPENCQPLAEQIAFIKDNLKNMKDNPNPFTIEGLPSPFHQELLFGNSDIRKLLADIQIEEQNHAEMLWKYKTANGMA